MIFLQNHLFANCQLDKNQFKNSNYTKTRDYFILFFITNPMIGLQQFQYTVLKINYTTNPQIFQISTLPKHIIEMDSRVLHDTETSHLVLRHSRCC